MPSFDDILSKGKGSAVKDATVAAQWKMLIDNILNDLNTLNALYPDPKSHYLYVEETKCKECDKATFLLRVVDYTTQTETTRYHLAAWKHQGNLVFVCPDCAAKKP